MREEDQLADILFAWRENRDRGEFVDPETVIREHPHLAERLRSWFLALAAVDEVLSEAPALAEGVPEQVGGYRILRELGAGGMGAVYLAEPEDAPGADPVALKVLHPHLLANPGTLWRFRREAQAGRAVDHENVLRTLDVGVEVVDGRDYHYLVLEYAEGRTLRELLADLGTVPEALLREVAAQVAAGVAAIHEAGLVHRDIKPENIVVTADRRVRIMDLGIARLLDATLELTKDGQFAGSLLYASPEQLAGREVGVEADLYAVGVTLYELATGENPFRRPSVPAIVHAQLHYEPPGARERNPDISPFLGELIAALLVKDPEKRLASSARLCAILGEAERSAWWRERERAIRDAENRMPRIPVRRETEITGRAGDLAALAGAWQSARGGAGGTMVVIGEAGIGKTRLIDEFLRGVAVAGANVLYGSYSPHGGRGGLTDALLTRFGEAELARSLTEYLPAAQRLVPGFASAILAESPPDGAEGLSRETLNSMFGRLAAALAEERPSIWVVEDIHNAPAESLAIVAAIARGAAGRRFLLILTTRTRQTVEPLTLLTTRDGVQRLELSRLSPREVVELLRDALKSQELADRLGARIAYQSDGVPFFICEMIRGLEEGQFITEQPDGSFAETKTIRRIETPEAVRELVAARLMGLSRMERAILDVGAVMGFEFDPVVVAGVREMKRLEVLECLAHLERRSGIVRSAERVCRFDHHQIQEVLYAEVPPDLRAEYHTLIADEIRARSGARGAPGTEADPVLLATHYLFGSRPEDALPHLAYALDRLAADLRRERALELADRSLALPGLLAGGPRAAVLLRRAGLLGRMGRREEERAALDEAVSVADGSGDAILRFASVVRLASWHVESGRAPDAEDLSRRALEAAEAAGDAGARARALRIRAAVSRMQGRCAEAVALGDRALDLSGRLNDPEAESRAALELGIALSEVGQRDRALTCLTRALDLARRVARPVREAEAGLAMGRLLLDLGRAEAARSLLDEILASCRSQSLRRGEARALADLGRHRRWSGQYGKTVDYLRRALTIDRELGHSRDEGRDSVALGEVLLNLGDPGQAEEHAQRAIRKARDVGDRAGEGKALHLLGLVGLAERRYPDARGRFEQALELARACEAPPAIALTTSSLAESDVHRGDKESARSGFEEAGRLGRELDMPEVFVAAAAQVAALTGRWGTQAEELFEGTRGRIGHPKRLRIRFALFLATRNERHLAAARRLLGQVEATAPDEYRDGLREGVRLYREIG